MINKLLLSTVLSVSIFSSGYASDSSRALQNEAIKKMPIPQELQQQILETQAALSTPDYYISLINQPTTPANYKHQIEALDFLIANYNTHSSKIGKSRAQLYKKLASMEFKGLPLTPEERARFKEARHDK